MKKRIVGKLIEVKDGIAFCTGLAEVMYSEVVHINSSEQIKALVFDLQPDKVGLLILGDFSKVSVGLEVEATGQVLAIPVSGRVLGRVLSALPSSFGEPSEQVVPLENPALSVLQRKNVFRPLHTGIIGIDTLTPIGKGQRQLIIGDRQTGKTSICLDTIINQKGQNVICIYVSIGQRDAKLAQLKAVLEETGALEYTSIVSENAAAPAALQYLAPYTGCTIAEYFARQGKDVVIIYDDLTKHAWAYRELSLLFRRSPGREGYPGDIFYLHSRLLERAAQYSDDLGGGSITALPIIETTGGDISSYIPTNVISITDGQVFLDLELFNLGQRPAIDIGSSVSRVGGDAQTKPTKQVAAKLKLELAHYKEQKAFSQFGSDLDEDTKKLIARGDRLVELLKQPQGAPLPSSTQILLLLIGTSNILDQISIPEVREFITFCLDHLDTEIDQINQAVLANQKLEPQLLDHITAKVAKIMAEFLKVK